MYVSSKGMKSTGLEDEVHVSREANRGGAEIQTTAKNSTNM